MSEFALFDTFSSLFTLNRPPGNKIQVYRHTDNYHR